MEAMTTTTNRNAGPSSSKEMGVARRFNGPTRIRCGIRSSVAWGGYLFDFLIAMSPPYWLRPGRLSQGSSAKAEGRFGKQDFVYVAAEDVYRCPAGERLSYRFAGVEEGKTIRRYWTGAYKSCGLKAQCTT
jgi:hypothetical protein